jgi:hypothetical protein
VGLDDGGIVAALVDVGRGGVDVTTTTTVFSITRGVSVTATTVSAGAVGADPTAARVAVGSIVGGAAVPVGLSVATGTTTPEVGAGSRPVRVAK